MLTQREMDVALVEAKAEVQKMLQEWLVDYLGSRLDGDNTRRGEPASAEAQAAEGAGVTPESGQASY